MWDWFSFFVWLWHQGYNDFIKYAEEFSLIFYFLEWLFVRGKYFFLEFLEKIACKFSGTSTVCGIFLTIELISIPPHPYRL